MIGTFLLVFILAVVVGMITHYLLEYLWPTTCVTCCAESASADIWGGLGGSEDYVGVQTPKSFDSFLDDDDDEIE